MHDIRLIRDDPAAFDAALARRGVDPVSGSILALDITFLSMPEVIRIGPLQVHLLSTLLHSFLGRTLIRSQQLFLPTLLTQPALRLVGSLLLTTLVYIRAESLTHRSSL